METRKESRETLDIALSTDIKMGIETAKEISNL